MAFSAKHRYARISARKVRPLADMVRGKFADEALDLLRYQPQRGARMLEKVIRSALGNAQDPDQSSGQTADIESLVIEEVRVDEGPKCYVLRGIHVDQLLLHVLQVARRQIAQHRCAPLGREELRVFRYARDVGMSGEGPVARSLWRT